MANKLRQRLSEGALVFDGAMGTEIYKRDFFVNTSFDGLNLTAPQVISEIHASYVDAGADVITTNTFAANRVNLSKFGLGEKTLSINESAVDLARSAVGDAEVLVAGSIGPTPRALGDADGEASLDALVEQLRILEGAGVDFVIFETLHSSVEVDLAFRAASAGNVPYMLSFSVDRECRMVHGEPLEKALEWLTSSGRVPTALGLNCCVGPDGLLQPLERLLDITDLPIVAQPNAGMPKQVGGRMIYMASPEYFATYALRFVNLGASGVGGCCGTGPEHISELAKNVKKAAVAERKSKTALGIATVEIPDIDPVPTAEKSRLGAKLSSGDWINTVEITPPRGYDLSAVLRKASLCRESGVDAINIPDGPRASSRISPLVTALKIQNEVGIETILHFCCRDRNLIGMQSDLLGCAAAGVGNILFVTGDPPKLGHYPDASAVFDADSIGMVRYQSLLNRGVDIGGNPIPEPTKALIGVGADPNAIDMERELRRTREKADAGAEFVITQPVFSVAPLFKFLDAIGDMGLSVIAGIWPLASYRNAEFMRNEVPGVVVPDNIMDRMAKHETKEAQRSEGIAIAGETLAAIRGRVSGVQVSAPFGNVETALAVIR